MKRSLIKKIIVIAVAVLLIGVPAVYLNTSYHAGETALSVINTEHNGVKIEDNGKYYTFVPDDVKAGFIFYPGGKVDTLAYAPLMEKCAEEGILCILVHMPFNLAVFDINAADRYTDLYPEVERWYIGGHSLGSACASMYIDEHRDLFEGLILLASYSTKDLSDSGLSVLSITASNDGILNFDKYTENIRNLPADHIEYQIKGGNHSQFADYGFQKGDGKATIDPEEQLEDVSTAIITFIG